jgi:hypothetical protein
LEALDGNEPVDRLQPGPKGGRDVQVFLSAPLAGLDFEDHGDHDAPAVEEIGS